TRVRGHGSDPRGGARPRITMIVWWKCSLVRSCQDLCVDSVLWIALGVVLALAEIFTTTLFLIMFAVGAFAAAGAAALGAPVAVQGLVFTAVSALTVVV